MNNEKQLTKMYLEFEGIPFQEETDAQTLYTYSKGRSPVFGFWIFKNKTLVTSFYETIDLINKAGLRRV